MSDIKSSLDRDAFDRVLLLAPYRRDSEYLSSLLNEHHIEAVLAVGTDLAQSLREASGVLIATHEALTPTVVEEVAKHLADQPSWSEMPVVILLDRMSPDARIRSELADSWPRARLLFYQRPVSALELLSGIQSAMLARMRQREVGDHIEREIELRRELNHRVKNILASVASIFQMTRRGAASLEELSADFVSRLQALSNVHSAVFQADDDAVSVHDVAALTFAPYEVRGTQRIIAKGPHLMLGRESATTLALCLHELTTNAIKYGALSFPAGRVTFEWQLDSERLSIRWCEEGGPPVIQPQRSGYGTKYLRAALTGLFGEAPSICFLPSGLECAVSGDAKKILGNF